MDLNLQITDIAGARPEYSTMIVNFVAAVRKQLRNSMCYVFKTGDGENKTVIPGASIKLPNKITQRKYFY